MARRQKQTTCFDEDVSRHIKSHIRVRARNHNCLILNGTMNKLTMAAALEMFVAPRDRAMAVSTHHRFRSHIRPDAYKIHFSGVPKIGEEARLRFWWDNQNGFNDPDCFVIAESDQNLPLGSTLQPTPLTYEMLATVEEWTANAIEWGLVESVFDTLNEDIVKPRDYAHMSFLLPMITSVIADFDKSFAQQIAGLRPPVRPPVEQKYLAGIQRANRTLAASCLLPTCAEQLNGPVYIGVLDTNSVDHPDWPWTIFPEFAH